MTKEQDRSVSLRKISFPDFVVFRFQFYFPHHDQQLLAQIFENIHGGSKEVGIALMIAALCELPGMIFLNSLSKRNPANFGCLLPVFHLLSEDS